MAVHPNLSRLTIRALRSAGKTKRDNVNENEELLLMETLRGMNLSKLVAHDVPLFLGLLDDLFPAVVSVISRDAHVEVRLCQEAEPVVKLCLDVWRPLFSG